MFSSDIITGLGGVFIFIHAAGSDLVAGCEWCCHSVMSIWYKVDIIVVIEWIGR